MKYKYYLKNLDCVKCTMSLEEHLNKDKNLTNVKLNFNKLTLTLETNLNTNVKNYINKKIHEINNEVTINETKEEDNNKKIIIEITLTTLGILLGIISIILKNNILMIASYLILIIKIAYSAIKKLFITHTIDEELLITISTLGAYTIDYKSEGLMVLILYKIGKILEHIALNNSRKSISNLTNILPEYANLKIKDTYKKVNPKEVKINDIILIKKGEQVPLDGIIIKGKSYLDTKTITGETELKEVKEKDKILSGSINKKDILEIKVTKKYEESTVYRILELVENATDRKTKTENFVTKIAKIYTPIVIFLAIAVVIILPLIFNITLKESLYRALSFLVISCPCAIVISVPLSYFTGIGKASKEKILIKGSDYLDNLRLINTIVFDKTGTITTTSNLDIKLEILNNKYKEEEIIDYILQGENLSTHPLAVSIIKYFNQEIKAKNIEDFKEITGKGISYRLNNKKILIGNTKLINKKEKDQNIYIKIDNEVVAKMQILDQIKPNVKKSIEKLNKLNIKTMMFTGDSEEKAKAIGKELNIQEVKSELLPEDKYNLLETIINSKNKVAFVGDGINDAPAIRRSDIGISMGNIGSKEAIESSDIVIVNDDIGKIVEAINISKKTNKIIKENLIFALSIKIIVLILSICGISTMWQAVFADTGVTLLTIINTTRILKK